MAEECLSLGLRLGRGHDGHRKTKHILQILVRGFWEDGVLFNADRHVAHIINSLWIKATEVARTRKRNVNELINEVVHTSTAHRYLQTNHIALAQQAGLATENVFAEVRPERKAEIVRDLQARGERVAFVGDGINDAPALTQADLGIAVTRASDVAREAADVILLRSDIEAIPEALALAQATLRTIRQNLFWAFFYNAAAVPLAAFGWLTPVVCAAAMGLSDVLVIGNALRLRRWQGKK